MSVTRKPLRIRHYSYECSEGHHEWCDPVQVIVVTGHSDIYRLARHLETGQTEFCAMGRGMLRALDRWKPGMVRSLTAYMGPGWAIKGGGYPGRRPRRRPQLVGRIEAEA